MAIGDGESVNGLLAAHHQVGIVLGSLVTLFALGFFFWLLFGRE